MESRLKKAHVNESELFRDAFLVKAVRFKKKQRHGLIGREKLLFLEAVSGRQEHASATVTSPAEARVFFRTQKKPGLQDRVMQSRFLLVDEDEGKITSDNPLQEKAFARIEVSGCADPDVLDMRRDCPAACRKAINVLLALSASSG